MFVTEANSSHSAIFPQGASTIPDHEPPPILSVVQRVIALKEKNVEDALNNRTDYKNHKMLTLGEVTLIGGDLFSTAYLIFQGVTPWVHISALTLGWVMLVCGCVAGTISVGVALLSLFESLQAFYNGNFGLGVRLFLDFIGLLGIGVIMILTALAVKVAVGSVTVFFAAHPWILPLLYFAITIPLLIEISSKITKSCLNWDSAASLKLPELLNLLKKDQVDWNEIAELYEEGNPFHATIAGADDLIERMEIFQSEMGVRAGVEAFKLFECLLAQKDKEALAQCVKVQDEITKWNFKQFVRLCQQILYVIAFVLSILALHYFSLHVVLVSVTNFLLAEANAIPIYLDIFCPFERNTTLVVPKVEIGELNLDDFIPKQPEKLVLATSSAAAFEIY